MLPTAATTVIEATFAAGDGPLIYDERASRRSALTLSALWLPLIAVPGVPGMALLASAPSAQVDGLSAWAIAAILLVLAMLAATPLVHLLVTFGQRRRIMVDNGVLHVDVRAPLLSTRLSRPLDTFRGVTHRVRTSLSGVEHEILLVPRDAGQQVRIHRADRIAPDTVSHVAARVGLPVIAATTAPFGAGAQPAIRAIAPQQLATA
jgi:hypothetical protein